MADDPTLAGVLAAIEGLRVEVGAFRNEVRNSFVAERTDRETQITRYRTDTMDRMDRLGNSLTAIRDDIAVNYGTAADVRRANDNTREELRTLHDVVMTMERQIQRLQTDVRTLKGDP